MQTLEGSDWSKVEVIQESDDIKVYKFIKNGGVIHVAWWEYFNDSTFKKGTVKSIELANLEGRAAVVTDSVPGVSSGNLVTDYESAFNAGVHCHSAWQDFPGPWANPDFY